MKRIITLSLSLLMAFCLLAQPAQKIVTVPVAPDHSDWLYSCGQKANLTVRVNYANTPVKDAKINYEISEDMMPAIKQGSMVLKDGEAVINIGTMKKPGFLRLKVWTEVNGIKYEGMATAGFDIDKIAPTVEEPADFDAFWKAALEENAKIPMLPEMKLLPERCTPEVDVYLASFQTARVGGRFFGTLCVPKNVKGRCPAILIVPGAGCRARNGYFEEAKKGFVTMEIGINGIPTTMDDSIYENLRGMAVNNYHYKELDDKDRYIYKNIFIGCARAIDFLAGLDFVDADRIGVMGGSQGGALSLTTTALNPKVKCCGVFYPAMCDMTGYLHGRGGGWPHFFKRGVMATAERKATVPYYDGVNFARRISVPVFFSYGFNDLTCCPTSTTAAYNTVSSDKVRYIFMDTQHWTYPEQMNLRSQWMMDHLSK